ncbi:death domain-associated protein 6 [Solea solea]|uniref:death domain-associated protein 6 n=1 Tax=Solea solea TaxID=90069 RepID=UPI00272CC3B2|nr:death domain-associated protein 6 [Solea solea]XP_058475842.1 death domain-associated protein 6 [Solea solea]XP_058475843.1 death domain-associated protein 6 [Solea solea]
MAVAPAWMSDKIIVLDDDDEEEESPQPPRTGSTSRVKRESSLKAQQPAQTHITQSPFATAKKQTHVLQAENEKLFSEFVEHCSTVTVDCPEVLNFLKAKYTKASPDYLSSVEFRNTLGRCLTRAQSNRTKSFVFINELCTVLRKHSVKKRQVLTRVEPGSSTSASTSLQPTFDNLISKDKTKGNKDNEVEVAGEPAVEDEQPSTSVLLENRENKEEQQEAERKAKRASRKQIAYLENLLKVYHEEICRLQQTELSLDEMEAEDSLYIQEHKLKRKMMKIYEKLCELKGCNTLTGRVIEQKIPYTSTRYPEINRRIERFINSPEAHRTPPDYQDILQQVLRANERHNLHLSRKQLNQMALDAFRETGSRMQERRHLDLVYNFGSLITDSYKPSTDPALRDPTLHRKLRSNREVALSRLEEVITKYAFKQDDAEEEERGKRQEKEGNTSEKADGSKNVNGVEEAEEEEEDEEDESSDPDIEEEIEASTQQGGADEDENEEENNNEAEQAEDDANKDDQIGDLLVNPNDEEEEAGTSGISPLSHDSKSQTPPYDIPSPRDTPSQSEPMQTDDPTPITNGTLEEPEEEPVDSSSQVPAAEDPADASPVATNGTPLPPSPAVILEQAVIHVSNGTSPPPGPWLTRSRKRKREDGSESLSNSQPVIIDSEVDVCLDMGVVCCTSPPRVKVNNNQDQVSSLQTTPPPKKNKVNVATQCDPDEIIVLSDTD